MADDPRFYRGRAEAERLNAEAATLDNVRDRALRAEAAWAAMADRADKTSRQRAEREAKVEAARELREADPAAG